MGLREPSAVSVEIDELVVEGMDHRAANRLSGALQLELGRLIEGRGMPRGLRQEGLGSQTGKASMSLGDLTASPQTPPERLGRELASALYRELDS